MLCDNLADAIAKSVFLRQLHPPFHMGAEYQRTHCRRKFIVRIRPAELVFDEIIGLLELADIMIQCPDLA